ncbi:type 2 periplasmic-binding domain-containing protein [Streptacidiphilus sp. PAMC 29251]
MPETPSRRSVLKMAGIGLAATVTAGPLLAACSSGGGSGSGGKISNAGAKSAAWPTYTPIAGAKPDLAGTAAGVQDTYLKYPSDLFQSTHGTPGDGSKVTMMCISYGTVTSFDDSNKLFKAVKTGLGVDVDLKVVPDVGTGYLTTYSTMTASGNIPDLTAFEGGYTIPNQSQFIASQCADLTEYLSGDAIKDYPNLANIPTYVWEGMGRIGGRIYGVPIHRPRIQYAMFGNGTKLTPAGLDAKGLSVQQFTAGLSQINGSGHYALGDCGTLPFGFPVHAASAGAPNAWSLSGGQFTSTYATEEFRQSLVTMQSLWSKGLWDPDATSMTATQMKTLFANGTTTTVADGWGGFASYVSVVGSAWPVKIMRPYGAKPTPWFGTGSFGFTTLKKSSPERIKMLLRVMDYLAAPFGSKEWELINYGVEGVHFTRGADGGPSLPTALGKTESYVNVPFRYVAAAPQVIYNPGFPDASREAYQAEQDIIPLGVANPAVPFLAGSVTASTKAATLSSGINDAILGIVSGKQPLSSWDGVVKRYRTQGGDQIAKELAAQYAAANA